MIARTTAWAGLAGAVATCLAMLGCDRGSDLSSAYKGASQPMAPSNMESDPAIANTIGGTSIVADTTFSASAEASAAGTQTAIAGSSDPDALMMDAPTSAGMKDGKPPAATPSVEVLRDADRRFINAAIERSQYEAAVARLAFNKAKEPEVKLFAKTLLEHHTQAGERLKQLAGSRGIVPPAKLPSDRQAAVERLASASGSDFDIQFLNTAGIKDHKADIALFEKASAEASDPAVKTFAQANLPLLRQHLSQAQALQQTQESASRANPLP